MYEIKVKTSFSAAHNLRNYRGKCEKLHGHNWLVEAVFSFSKLDKSGIAMDFKIAKGLLKKAVEEFDHSYLNDIKVLRAVNPTSENVAQIIYSKIKRSEKNLMSISVWENENSCATYSEDRAPLG